MANRVGTALRKLSTQSKKKGVTLGGRGHGKLTHSAIAKLRGYYGKAIRGHPMTRRQTIHSTTAALMAKQVGASSGVQRRMVPFPGPHHDKVGTPLSPEVAPRVNEVYMRLGHSALLRRCPRSGRNVRRPVLLVWRGSPLLTVLLSRRSTVGLISRIVSCVRRWASSLVRDYWYQPRRLWSYAPGTGSRDRT